MSWLEQLKSHQRGSVGFVGTTSGPFSGFFMKMGPENRKIARGGGPPKLTKPSPVALKWVREYREELSKAGWTAAELYRRNKSRGVLWLTFWSTPDLEVSLRYDGTIQFKFNNRGVTLAARPKALIEQQKVRNEK